ncbi:hypothetical protein OBP_123 [Pseudomonas phage OBP]|uniref:hypothetical protein n=1 Tax=Pseudomonas phage OBP TaxID=1124849 RepID=UPI000240D4A9|nr:hypothetical protein OBP_123 [Pseudomonas phage OBP]AEV89560.1 hypothetical protein OBP_123 [Pseudomonas phage OBP]
MILRLGENVVDVLFLNEQHLHMLNSLNIELKDLPYLPKFNEVSDQDCLDWLGFQRAVEKQYCGFKTTTYDYASDITVGKINREGVVYKTKYDEVLNADRSVNLGSHFAYHLFNGKLFILSSSNTVNSKMFTTVQGNLASSLYQALLNSFSTFETYGRESKNLKESVSQRKYIDLGFVLSKLVN